MVFREATIHDIPHMQLVRRSVRENTLSYPSLVTDADCAEYITVLGKGWVCEANKQIVGFAIVDVIGHNIWALFIEPAYEKKGIGKQLHDRMMNWYFEQTHETVWLGTAFRTRAEQFYRKAGWIEAGMHGTREIKFVMTYERWNEMNDKS